MENKYITQVYATRNKDNQTLKISSSGGMFSVLANYILGDGGVIACAGYNYDNGKTEYTLIENFKDVHSAIGSKYMQSYPNEIFKKCKKWISDNKAKKLLFIGMGCQADAFRKYAELNNFRDRVYIVDIICHGSPSPKIWQEYAKLLEKENKGKITYVTFKDKRNGWKSPSAYVIINNQEVSISNYVKLFYSKCTLRPSCHKCPYATIYRKVDMTIGDFWGIDKVKPEFYSTEGNSLVLIHTENGENLFDSVKEWLDYELSDVEECKQPNLLRPTIVSEKRKTFWKDYYEGDIKKIVKKYAIVSFTQKIKNKLAKILGGGVTQNSSYQLSLTIDFRLRAGA